MPTTWNRILAAVLALLLVGAVAVPGAVAGATATDGDLTLEVTQDAATGNVTVSLADNGTAAAGANVTVAEGSGNYSDTGDYVTDANGTVSLAEPNETVTVAVEATTDGQNVSGEFELQPLEESLGVAVTQNGDDVTVSVEQYGTPVEGAAVNVSAVDENATYDDAGEYTTDANGTVALSAPAESLNVSVEAVSNNLTVSTTAYLEAVSKDLTLGVSQAEDASVIIDVRYGGEAAEGAAVEVTGDYEYAGSYTADANGTVDLPAPVNDTTINVTATYENETATATDVVIQAENDSNPHNDFAEALVTFIHHLRTSDLAGPPGQAISAFVHEHNPSSADDDAGPPEHAGPKTNDSVEGSEDGNGPPPWAGSNDNETAAAENETDDHGPPEHAGTHANVTDADGNETDEHGPPEHAGTDDDEADSDDNETHGHGPPEHAGSEDDESHSNGNGNDGGNGHGNGNGNENGNGPPEHDADD